jgi:Domain of unknown function (DUF4419)
MNTATATTFGISSVELATTPLLEIPFKQAVEALLSPSTPVHDTKRVERLRRLWILTPDPGSIPPSPVEACSKYHGKLIADIHFHPVVAAAHIAFMEHRPLCLSPDMIWLMICQAIANHVNVRPEQYRSKLVTHRGKIEILVRRDDFVKGSPENPWSEVLEEFSSKIRAHVGPKIELFLPEFSTTGAVERAACEVILLDAVRSYFDYTFYGLCGIPAIKLDGTTQDWRSLAERVEAFNDLELEPWLDLLAPVLTQFIRASQGEVDEQFWRSLYSFDEMSGCKSVTGWITVFFPYMKHHDTGYSTIPIAELDPEEEEEMDGWVEPVDELGGIWGHGLMLNQFSSGLSKAPFRWDFTDRSFDMEFLGGFVGVAQDQETLTLRPEIGWAVREVAATG